MADIAYLRPKTWSFAPHQVSFAIQTQNEDDGPSAQRANTFEFYHTILTFAVIGVVLIYLLQSVVRGLGQKIKLRDGGRDGENITAAEVIAGDDIMAASIQPILSEPIKEENYRAEVRRSRNILLLWVVISLALAVATFVELQKRKAPFFTILSLQADSLLWFSVLALLLTPLRTQGRWPHILQLNALLGASLITHGIRVITPPPLSWDEQRNVPIQLPAVFEGSVLWLQVAATIIALFAWITNGLTPSGPLRIVPSPNPGTVPTVGVLIDQSGGASIIGFLHYSYCFPVIKASYKKAQLGVDDVPYVPDSFRASELNAQSQLAFARFAAKDKKKGKETNRTKSWRAFRLLQVLLWTNRALVSAIIVSTVFAAASFYIPWLLLLLVISAIERSEENNEPMSIAIRQNIVYAVMFAVGQIASACLVNHSWGMSSTLLTNRFRSQLSVLLLNKSLRRKDITTVKDKETDGEGADSTESGGKGKKDDDESDNDNPAQFATKSKIISIQTVDIQRVEGFGFHIFVLIGCPTELITGGILAYRILGISAVIGLAMSLLTAPIVYLITSRIEKVQEKLMAARDSRTSAMNESFQAIRMIKFSSWERRVTERIMKARRTELKEQRSQYLLDACSEFLFFLSPMLVIVTAFTCYTVVFHNQLTPATAFTSLSVLQELRWSLMQLPDTISSAIQSWTSLKRIASYLDCPEVDVPDSVDLTSETALAADGEIRLQNATIGWPVVVTSQSSQAGSVAPTFRLRDVSVQFTPKQLNLICGKLGSGKSLLLLGLLGEADLLAGSLKCPRSIPDAVAQSGDPRIYARGEWISPLLTAYVPQSAFLTNASLRDNILFGLPMIRERYDAVLDACALLPDLAMFEDGDQVEIGEGGIGLSGGQKARVSLARAVYSRAQTLLLDDILSAVDAHTASHIHKQLLQGPLLKDRTVLLVSHQVQLLAPSAAKVVLLDNGVVRYEGQASDFLQSEHYRGLLDDDKEEKVVQDNIEDGPQQNGAAESAGNDKEAGGATANGKADDKDATPGKAAPRKLVEDEGRNVGAIGLQTWKRYLQMAGGSKVIFVFIAIIIPNIWTLVSSWWLRAFSADAKNGKDGSHSIFYWMTIYTALVMMECVFHFVKWIAAYAASLHASQVIFEAALNAVFRAPMRFHDTVPRGRLLNRFTNDQEAVDSSLAANFVTFLQQGFAVVFGIVAVCIGGGPSFLLVVAIMAPLYYWTAKVFAGAARDVRRLQQTTKSPVVQTFADVVNGVAVVRAFGASATTLSSFFVRMDNSLRYAFLNRMCPRWLNILYAVSTAVLYFFATALIMISGADSAVAAFALSFLLQMGNQLAYTVVCYSENESRGVAIERLVEYADLEPEAALIVEPRPPASWPHSGQVTFENLRLRYAPDLPEVLKGVSFEIAAGQKVGIVGPTGCGKSTTVTSLFRLVDNFSGGRVVIDGIDISKIGLEDLRSRLMIVPQDPVILSGSLRDSIDIFQEHTDEDIIAALKKVHLIGSPHPNSSSLSRVVAPESNEQGDQNVNVFEDLKYNIAEGGSNLSNGQRQLLCMARALLGRAKVVVFDEASSSVDVDADDLITATLQEEFSDCTVITIAHRLRTIMHSDRVVVMDKGTVSEFASPVQLLERPESHFYKLCAASGKAEFEKLREMAALSSTASSSKTSSVSLI
ncbi:unnamed protein product [Tilletia controversa]|uniref:Uncharacterized protein n=3 Tax=Tilletia TaxID=13289 RepID=A0A8X7SYL4_9BASI|nr:hypothetical protein CF336_g2447 [Tilletia laevis]KAE8202042.1 hypothetical protein CF328_g2443 [Tilletia controversa]KAE8252785.1 hypothetical protein A4X03_0g6077 [Tilletia caries]KAE8206572.1 hypothetical protein CF335_g1785 [Tilletia laevis]KAE8251592.1 hypothetical protein A4X06_0g2614 [Tilletia controversa]